MGCDTSQPIRGLGRDRPIRAGQDSLCFCRLSLQSPGPLSLAEDLILWDITRLYANGSRGETACQGVLGSSPLTDQLPLPSWDVPRNLASQVGQQIAPWIEALWRKFLSLIIENFLTWAIFFTLLFTGRSTLHLYKAGTYEQRLPHTLVNQNGPMQTSKETDDIFNGLVTKTNGGIKQQKEKEIMGTGNSVVMGVGGDR